MLNLLKSDLYRLVHGKMLWVGLAALLAVVVGAAGLIWFATTPLFAEMVNEQAANNQAAANAGSTWNMQLTTPNNADLDAAEVEALNEKVINSRTYSYGSTFMVGFLGLIVSVLAALIAASDFDSGFAKSVLAGRRSRLPYFGESSCSSLLCVEHSCSWPWWRATRRICCSVSRTSMRKPSASSGRGRASRGSR